MQPTKRLWMRNKSTFLGICMLSFSMLLFYLISQFPDTADEYRTISPTFFPYMLSAILAGLSVLLIMEGFRSDPKPVFSIQFRDSAAYRTGMLLIILIVFASVLTTLGFALASLLFMLSVQLLLGERKLFPLEQQVQKELNLTVTLFLKSLMKIAHFVLINPQTLQQ